MRDKFFNRLRGEVNMKKLNRSQELAHRYLGEYVSKESFAEILGLEYRDIKKQHEEEVNRMNIDAKIFPVR